MNWLTISKFYSVLYVEMCIMNIFELLYGVEYQYVYMLCDYFDWIISDYEIW